MQTLGNAEALRLGRARRPLWQDALVTKLEFHGRTSQDFVRTLSFTL